HVRPVDVDLVVGGDHDVAVEADDLALDVLKELGAAGRVLHQRRLAVDQRVQVGRGDGGRILRALRVVAVVELGAGGRGRVLEPQIGDVASLGWAPGRVGGAGDSLGGRGEGDLS